MFFIEHGDRAVFGASPEFLVRLDGRRRGCGRSPGRPAAGSARDAAIARAAGLTKRSAEHVMLVDLGCNDIASVCEVGSVRVDELW